MQLTARWGWAVTTPRSSTISRAHRTGPVARLWVFPKDQGVSTANSAVIFSKSDSKYTQEETARAQLTPG